MNIGMGDLANIFTDSLEKNIIQGSPVVVN